MNNLWYPKQSPIITLTGMSGGATSLGISRGEAPPEGGVGDGHGYTITQGASAVESNSITSTSSTYVTDSFAFVNGSGTQGDYLDFSSASNYAFNTGAYNSNYFPFHFAVKVSEADYGRVINQIEWRKGKEMCGAGSVYGSSYTTITAADLDATGGKWTWLGNVNFGGTNNVNLQGGQGGTGEPGGFVSRQVFNPNSYGFKWYMVVITDTGGAGTTGPNKATAGQLTPWQAYSLRFNYFNVGGAVGTNKIWPSYRYYKYIPGSTSGMTHNPMTTVWYGMEDDFDTSYLLKDLGGTTQGCNDTGSWNYANWTSNDLGSNKQIMNIFPYSNFGGSDPNVYRRYVRYTLQGSTDNSSWTTMWEGEYDTWGQCGWRGLGGPRWWS